MTRTVAPSWDARKFLAWAWLTGALLAVGGCASTPPGDVRDRTHVDERMARQRTVMLKQVPAHAAGAKET